jgi:hypothetical protein
MRKFTSVQQLSVSSSFGKLVENILFSHASFARARAASRRALAPGSRLLMNFHGDGHTKGSAANGLRRAAHAVLRYFIAMKKGV